MHDPGTRDSLSAMNNFTGKQLRDWWRRAADEGRLRPGNGPEYTRRILPHRRPFLGAASVAAREITRHELERDHQPVARGVYFQPLPEDTPHQVRGDDPGLFPADAVTRARAQHLRHPEAVIGGWPALAFQGLLHWADSAPVILLQDRHETRAVDSRQAAKNPLAPVFRRWHPKVPRETCTPDPRFPELLCVSAPLAVAQCLRSVFRRTHTWPVPEVPGLEDIQVRAVQLIDHVLQCTIVTLDEITRACRHHVSARRLAPVLALVDHGAQSPRETLLRLVIRDSLPEGFTWSSQVRVAWGTGRGKSTVLDLACEELKIAVYYDGSTHRGEEQTTKDIDQIQELKDMGWEVLRVDAELFHNRAKLHRLLDNMVDRAFSIYEGRQDAA